MRKHTKILSVVALIFLICSMFAGTVLAVNVSDDSSSNKYNIVFVSDESGSMRYTDPSLYRYDAIDLFLGLMSNEGNYVGLVSFDSTAYDSQAVAEVGSKAEKDALSATIRGNQGTNGDTDIGGALVKAVELLDANANPDLPSIILLLTDGNTDLDNNPGVVSEEELESEQAKADAVEACREAGYTIYSICLNIDGSADIAETEQIATATGGRAMEVNDASDLDEVFEAFYQLIYGTSPIDVINGTFEVPSAGVEEANILIHGDVTEVIFTAPDGSDYPDAEMTRIGDITLEKIIKPAAGTWKVTVNSETGAKFYIRLLFNYLESEKFSLKI